MTDFFHAQLIVLLVWAAASFGFIWVTRQPLVAFVSTLTFALAVVAYFTSTTGALEFGGLPFVLAMGLMGWGAAVILARRQGWRAKKEADTVRHSGWQARRLLFCSLLGCGFVWGISIIFLVLPSSALTSFLRSIGGAHLPVEASTEYAVRMAFGVFTLVGLLFYVAASDIERHFGIIPFLGGLMICEAVILGTVGAQLKPDHPWVFESISCVGGGFLVLACWLRLRRMLTTKTSDTSQPSKVIDKP